MSPALIAMSCALALSAVLLVLLAVLLALVHLGQHAGGHGEYQGGAGAGPAAHSENLVVDTLNLMHWLRRRTPLKKVGVCDIVSTIDRVAPALRARFPGRVIFVTKDRESVGGSARVRALYQAAARRNRVYVDVVEKLPTDRSKAPASKHAAGKHAALGRDDFYIIMTAWKLRCGVLSCDRYRDLSSMKGGDLPPFHVYRYSPYKHCPDRDFVNPAAAEFQRMCRPLTFTPGELLPHH